MVISEKCNWCVHETVCSFKIEYLAECEAIKNATYESGHGFKIMKDSQVFVSIRCPHILTNEEMRRDAKND